jgi:hypothetical protein
VARLSFEIVQSKVDTTLSVEKSCSALSNSSLNSSLTTATPETAATNDAGTSSSIPAASQASVVAATTAAGSQPSSATSASVQGWYNSFGQDMLSKGVFFQPHMPLLQPLLPLIELQRSGVS